ncbi:hypothetical protein [Halosimplex halophilum]|uniref:hypothetical protein n=1 Tax=Halosimplex halophilum TaxID=2559572 RepID=UPI00107EFCBD|nr:hypothetical protein [Halosimplex halophilum]
MAGDGQTAFLEVENLGNTVDKKNQATDILRLRNNFDEALSLDVSVDPGSGLKEENGFATTVSANGGATTYSVSCDGNSGGGSTEVTVTVTSADGQSVAVQDAAYTFAIQRNCPGNGSGGGGGSGSGFDSIYAEDVSPYVQPGEERQTFSFVLAGNRKPNEQVSINLSDPRGNGVDYDQTLWNEDIRIESGSGSVWANGDSIVYQVSSQDKKGDTIELSVGSYATDGNGGPYDVTFTREDTGETGTTQFEITGDEGDGAPFTQASASDISGSNRQTFSFTPGSKIESYENVEIDLSDPRDDGVNYDETLWEPDIRVEQGAAGSDEIWASGSAIVYQVQPEDYAGEQIVVSAGSYEILETGKTYTVTFTRTDTGDQIEDTFTTG